MPEKKYFWLKLMSDFFNQREIKKLRKLAGGDTLTIIYLRIQLLSLKENAQILYAETEDSIYEQLAIELDEEEDNIKLLLSYLESHNLIVFNDDQDFILIETKELIGSETAGASRVRKHRAEKKLKLLQCNEGVTNCNTEKEKDIKKEEELDLEEEQKLDVIPVTVDPIPYADIISYLNEQTDNNYRTKKISSKYKDLIKARFNEDYTLEDFKKVIDNMAVMWLNNDQMQQYLRPETLFSNKFQSYLNIKLPKNSNSEAALRKQVEKGVEWANEE